MYAVIEDGSHQYKVEEGDTLEVQLHDLQPEADTIEFDKVLAVGGGVEPRIGQPYLEGAKVTASIVAEVKGQKIEIIKFRRRKNFRLKKGHRQKYLRVTIDKIEA